MTTIILIALGILFLVWMWELIPMIIGGLLYVLGIPVLVVFLLALSDGAFAEEPIDNFHDSSEIDLFSEDEIRFVKLNCHSSKWGSKISAKEISHAANMYWGGNYSEDVNVVDWYQVKEPMFWPGSHQANLRRYPHLKKEIYHCLKLTRVIRNASIKANCPRVETIMDMYYWYYQCYNKIKPERGDPEFVPYTQDIAGKGVKKINLPKNILSIGDKTNRNSIYEISRL